MVLLPGVALVPFAVTVVGNKGRDARRLQALECLTTVIAGVGGVVGISTA
jgi:hypothetical protein